ncbi:MAG TPA: hypothetical protein VFU47_10955, partial [Armatimonadota bacterium]|nr:hypothetical protein [Armatimonadota bacterium]
MDRLVKGLFRAHPELLLRLAAVEGPRSIRPGDVNVALPEFRADHVFFIGADDEPGRWAAHVEYQLRPDPRVLRGWLLKNAALNAQLDLPVLLIVIYLERGGRASFPETLTIHGGGLRNEFRFH